ncbi:MAG: LPS export ABC transporter permease LptG [Rhodospirillaceae bacterium]
MILSWYLTKAYLTRFFALLFGLVVFLQMLDLLANADAVLEGGGQPVSALGRYIILRVPSIIETVAPLAALLGGLTALVVLARNSEIIAMRAAGRSVLSLVGGLVAVGMILALVLFVFSDRVVVRFNAQLEDWKSTGYQPGGEIIDGSETWVIEGKTIIRVGHVLNNGSVLNDIRLFRQNETDAVTDIINIRLAIWEEQGWTFFGTARVGGDSVATPLPKPAWETKLTPDDFNKLANPPSELTFDELEHYVRELALGTRPEYYYDTWLQRKLAGPAVLALMPLLAAIAAFAHHRQGSAIMVIVYGISLGFVFIVTDNLLLAMGQFGALPPIVAAWLPLALFGTIGLWIVVNLENKGA